jgi:ferrochelatase
MSLAMQTRYDALVLLSFGGPEGPDDVIPFLENVLRGRNVPRERMLEVAEHYYHFGGRSPINQQCRELIEALKPLVDLPVYWGNRNWNPMLADTVAQMTRDGVRNALGIATSAFGSYSGCRQYREDIAKAAAGVEGAPAIEKMPPFWRHEGFLAAVADRVHHALLELPGAVVVYTAHSIPNAMAAASPYVDQLRSAATLVNQRLDLGEPVLAFQSRSGPPTQPWLEPDICDYIRAFPGDKLIVVPLGFLSDHMEVLYDLDYEAAAVAKERGIGFVRAGTAGTHPLFVAGLAELVRNAQENGLNACKVDCCLPSARPAARPA